MKRQTLIFGNLPVRIQNMNSHLFDQQQTNNRTKKKKKTFLIYCCCCLYFPLIINFTQQHFSFVLNRFSSQQQTVRTRVYTIRLNY